MEAHAERPQCLRDPFKGEISKRKRPIGRQPTVYRGQNNWEKGTPNLSGVHMRCNAVNTQGRAGPLKAGHGAGPMPEPLTFSHKSELPLNVVGRSGVWCSPKRGLSCRVYPQYCRKTLQTLDLFKSLLLLDSVHKDLELVSQ